MIRMLLSSDSLCPVNDVSSVIPFWKKKGKGSMVDFRLVVNTWRVHVLVAQRKARSSMYVLIDSDDDGETTVA